MGILRLSHVEVRVPDLELATAYYTEVLGLLETAREPERVFLKCWDEHEHHSVILRYAASYGLEHMGFKVQDAEDLEECERAVEKAGGRVTRHARGELAPGHGEAIRFDTPTGHRCELVWGMEKVGNLLPRTNPPPRPLGLVGIAPPRLDHVFVTAEDVEEGTRFFRDVLGFRLTEQVVADDGHQLATWLERSHSPHDIALVTGPNGGLHHFAFWLDDWNDVRTAADTWPTTASPSTWARPGTARPAATRSTSSTRPGTATRCSPAATGSTRTTSPSPGPRPRWAARSSTTRAPSTSGS
jgi:catechol 2,3-dioxygenase